MTKSKRIVLTKSSFSSVIILLMMVLTAPSISLSAQYTIESNASSIYINGTSTLHNWVVMVEQIKGSLKAVIENNHIKKLDSVEINIPVLSLKSGKSDMDENVYKALKSKQFPEITYRLKDYTIENTEITTTGIVTVAGVNKIINSKINYQNSDNYIKFDGETTINMSDFNIKPPEFLLGAFKTGDKITIRFYFMFRNNHIN